MASAQSLDASWRTDIGSAAGVTFHVASKRAAAPLRDQGRTSLPEPVAVPRHAAEADPAELADLIARMVRRDEVALAALYDATVSRVYGLALRIVRQAAAAEEVAIDTFHQAWREAARFDAARGAPLAWLLMMCRSRALDLLRARDTAITHEDPESLRNANDGESGDDPLDLVAAMESHTTLAAALRALAPSQRQMLGLAFLRGFTHEEIAMHAALPLGTVKSQIRRALVALRGVLDGHPGETR